MPLKLQYTDDGLPYYQNYDNDGNVAPNPLYPSNPQAENSNLANYASSLPLPVEQPNFVDYAQKAARLVTGLNLKPGEERFKFWPEQAIESGINSTHEAATGAYGAPNQLEVPEKAVEEAEGVAGLMSGGMFPMKPGTASLGSGLIRNVKPQANAPVFYSAVEHAVNNIDQPRMTGQQWLSTISAKPGVKPEELNVNGLKEYLTDNAKEPITKEQIQEHLTNNQTELKTFYKGENVFNDRVDELNKQIRDLQQKRKDELGIMFTSEFDKMPREQKNKLIDRDIEYQNQINDLASKRFSVEDQYNTDTRYSLYQMPGGENYREFNIVYTNPNFKKAADKLAEFEKLDFEKSLNSESMTEQERAEFKKLRDAVRKIKHYKSPHPGIEDNTIVHGRANDRIIGNQKSYHVEEIQSDLHQQGREYGYKFKNDEERNKAEELFNKIDDKIISSNDEKIMGHPDIKESLKMAVDKGIITQEEAKIYKRYSDSEHIKAVPDFPFKQTEAWVGLALKHIIRDAAEKGYDRVSWTPGEAQSANPKNLGETNEAAEKADKGLKFFYNELLPKIIEKILKEHGVKVKEGEVRYGAKNETTQKVYYIDLPQSLKDQSIRKGFPLFSNGMMLTPVDHDPYKTTPVDFNPFTNPNAM